MKSIVAPIRAVADELGGAELDDGATAVEVPQQVVVATGGTEGAVLELVNRRGIGTAAAPAVLVAHPAHNSLLARTPVVPTGRLTDRFVAAGGVAGALDDVVEAGGFDAISVRCFDLLHDPGTSGCLALAELNDDGIVAGCEGDLPSTLGMLWARHLRGRATWMANPSRLDRRRNELVLAHCTVAPSLTEGYSLSTHFESGIGVGISGRFAEQPVTLLRIGGRDLDRCWIAEGEIIEQGDEPDLCRTQVTVALSDGSVDDLLERPLGKHLVMVGGHHAARLRRWWQLAIADSSAPG